MCQAATNNSKSKLAFNNSIINFSSSLFSHGNNHIFGYFPKQITASIMQMKSPKIVVIILWPLIDKVLDLKFGITSRFRPHFLNFWKSFVQKLTHAPNPLNSKLLRLHEIRISNSIRDRTFCFAVALLPIDCVRLIMPPTILKRVRYIYGCL